MSATVLIPTINRAGGRPQVGNDKALALRIGVKAYRRERIVVPSAAGVRRHLSVPSIVSMFRELMARATASSPAPLRITGRAGRAVRVAASDGGADGSEYSRSPPRFGHELSGAITTLSAQMRGPQSLTVTVGSDKNSLFEKELTQRHRIKLLMRT